MFLSTTWGHVAASLCSKLQGKCKNRILSGRTGDWTGEEAMMGSGVLTTAVQIKTAGSGRMVVWKTGRTIWESSIKRQCFQGSVQNNWRLLWLTWKKKKAALGPVGKHFVLYTNNSWLTRNHKKAHCQQIHYSILQIQGRVFAHRRATKLCLQSNFWLERK